MEGSSLFNSGFLGSHFSWWVGQIADDSQWRDNIEPGKHEDVGSNPGWGKRYKVRIIGFHDQKEEVVESSQLPWAQVMYPVTAGGGQTESSQTSNLRQGNFVFGFFLDSEDQQVPVIMGVLGHNAKIVGKTKIGTTESNFGPTSGYAAGVKPKTGSVADNERPSDESKKVVKPTGGSTEKSTAKSDPICGSIPSNVKLNKYGLRPDVSVSSIPGAQNAVVAARNKARAEGLSKEDENAATAKAVLDAKKAYCKEKQSATAPPKPGATKENVDDTQLTSAADVKDSEQKLKKIPLENSQDTIGTSMRAMQIVIENLMKDINKILATAAAYVDAVSSVASGSICDIIDKLIQMASEQIAKYMKPIFDKIKQYISKKVQTAMDKPAANLFPNQRFMIADMKEQITELLNCIFEKIISKLTEQILSALSSAGGMLSMCNGEDGSKGKDPCATNSGGNRGAPIDKNLLTPDDQVTHVSICYVENLVGDLIASNKSDINEGINEITRKVDRFLGDQDDQIQMFISEAQGQITASRDVLDSIDGMVGNIGAALSFMDMKFDLLGCDFNPIPRAADFYTFQNGGGSGEQADFPRFSQVSKASSDNNTKIDTCPPLQYATPSKDLEDLPRK
jgi:hypothetical protein